MLSLQNGRPGFDQVTGRNAWEHLQANAQTQTIFNQTMRDLSPSISSAVAASFDWSRFPVVADIGGGIGSQLSSILDAHPSCRGILFDQPTVVAEAPEHGRIERVGGDFFDDLPMLADAYVMRWVLHDWSDEESTGLLTNVRRVAAPDARLMVVESVIPEAPEFDMGKWMDVNMMMMATGRERTAAEFRDLFGRAGFALEQIVPTASPLSIVVGTPLVDYLACAWVTPDARVEAFRLPSRIIATAFEDDRSFHTSALPLRLSGPIRSKSATSC